MAVIYYRKQTLENIAWKTLIQYDPNYMDLKPQPVPVEIIIEDVFNLSIDYMRITKSGEQLGRMVFEDGVANFYNPDTDKEEQM